MKHKELVKMVGLTANAKGTEIGKAPVNKLTTCPFQIVPIVSTSTTDGASSMVGTVAGFVTLLTIYVRHPLLGFHYIVHKEALCAKSALRYLKKWWKL
jgi:uncharacterized membrane protein